LASSAAARRVTTSTIGYAEHFDETMLAAMASGGQGNTYWCAGPDEAPKIFAAEFEGLASVVAQNVSVEIRPIEPPVANVGVLNDFPMVNVEGGMQVMVGDAYGDEVRRVVFRLHIPGLAEIGATTVANVVIRWVEVGEQVRLHTVTVPVVVNAVPTAEAVGAVPNAAVTEQVLTLEAARARKDAREAAERGYFGGAAAMLRTSASILRSARSTMAESAMIDSEADDLEVTAAAMDNGQYDTGTAKRMWSQQQAAATGRRTRFEDDSED
jgi:Ca-activated chloride channel family protein